MFATLGNLVKVLFFFIDLWREKDKKKAAEKKAIAEKVTDAFKETDAKKRASRLNAAVADINRLRG